MMINPNTLLLVLLGLFVVGFTIFAQLAKVAFARLTVIQLQTNGGMGAALRTAVAALRSDASSKRQLAAHIGGREQIEAAEYAATALKEGEIALQRHVYGQALANQVR